MKLHWLRTGKQGEVERSWRTPTWESFVSLFLHKMLSHRHLNCDAIQRIQTLANEAPKIHKTLVSSLPLTHETERIADLVIHRVHFTLIKAVTCRKSGDACFPNNNIGTNYPMRQGVKRAWQLRSSGRECTHSVSLQKNSFRSKTKHKNISIFSIKKWESKHRTLKKLEKVK
jgi:hypothetical protein